PLASVIVTKNYYQTESIPNTLQLMEDDVVHVLSKPNEHWWDGVLVDPVGNVTRGWFPASYTRPPKQHQSTPHQAPVSTARSEPPPSNASSPSIFKEKNYFVPKTDSFLTSSLANQHQHESRQSSKAHTETPPYSLMNSMHMVTNEEISSYFQTSNSESQPSFNFVPIWLPQFTIDNQVVYKDQALKVLTRDIPFVDADYLNEDSIHEVPDTSNLVADLNPLPISLQRQNTEPSINSTPPANNFKSYSIYDSFHGSTNKHAPQQTQVLINMPDFANVRLTELFYTDNTDILTWDALASSFINSLDRSISSLEVYDKQKFKDSMNACSNCISSLHTAGRLIHQQLLDSNKQIQFTAILNKITNMFIQFKIWTTLTLVSLDSMETSKNSKSLGISNPEDVPKSKLSSYHDDSVRCRRKLEKLVTHLCLVTASLSNPNQNGIFAKNDSKILPMIYPRFVRDKFEGGNFKNKFVDARFSQSDFFSNPAQNQVNILLDDEALNKLASTEKKILESLKEVQDILSFKLSKDATLKTFMDDRNLKLLAAIYQCIPLLCLFIDTIESIDMTVFAMINKLAARNSKPERQNTIDSESSSQSFYDATAKVFRPMINEFMYLKQLLHSAFTDLVLDAQTITATDPETFFPIEREGPSSDKPISKSKQLTEALMKQLELINSEIYHDGVFKLEPNLKLLETIRLAKGRMRLISVSVNQLKEERRSILNYCSRVMNTDFNIASLFIAERHNTLVSMNSQSTQTIFTGNRATNDLSEWPGTENIPWYMGPDHDEEDLIYETSNLRGGPVRSLVAKLVNPTSPNDELFEQTFFSFFSTFVKPVKLFEILIEKYHIGMPDALSYEEYEYIDYFHLGCMEPKQIPVSPMTPSIKQLRLQNLNINYVADQITAVQAFYYRKLNLWDLLGRTYNFSKILHKKNDRISYNMKDPLGTKNISNFVKNCNNLTHFTTYMILRKDSEERINAIKFFISLAEKLLSLKNFSSMTAIISGLGSTSISRLRKTWDAVPSFYVAKFQKMDNLMSIGKNYSEYRNILRFMETDDDPYLPFLGMYLSDLRFTTDGNSDWLGSKRGSKGLVNFSKRMSIMKIMKEVLNFNETLYKIELDTDFSCYLNEMFTGLPDDERMYELSIQIEPRVSLLKNPKN
ncbi:hypothetical protein PICMEDRAFT_25402, partial [Pichia membranifaciens NRRL Y-2026]